MGSVTLVGGPYQGHRYSVTRRSHLTILTATDPGRGMPRPSRFPPPARTASCPLPAPPLARAASRLRCVPPPAGAASRSVACPGRSAGEQVGADQADPGGEQGGVYPVRQAELGQDVRHV